MYQSEMGEESESERKKKFEKWQEEVDEFGLIVSIAAGLKAG